MENLNLNLFEVFENNEEIKQFEEEQKKVVETKKVETKSKNVSSDNKDSKAEIKKQATKPKENYEAKLLADLKKSKKIICKVFGKQAFVLEDEEQIKAINTKQDIVDLLFDNGFEEFTAFNPELKYSIREDGTAILLPLYPDMKPKG